MILNKPNVHGIQNLECQYKSFENWAELWKKVKYCAVNDFEFPTTLSSDNGFKFSGSNSDKAGTTAVLFSTIRIQKQFKFIPDSIFDEFPSLIGIIIWNWQIPILTEQLFNGRFENISHIELMANYISSIEPRAFWKLTKLEWFSMRLQKIKCFDHQILEKNPKLEFIDLSINFIEKINPNFFDGLSNLKQVSFESNKCADGVYGCENCTSNSLRLHDGLVKCFANFIAEPQCILPEKTTEFVVATTEKVTQSFWEKFPWF